MGLCSVGMVFPKFPWHWGRTWIVRIPTHLLFAECFLIMLIEVLRSGHSNLLSMFKLRIRPTATHRKAISTYPSMANCVSWSKFSQKEMKMIDTECFFRLHVPQGLGMHYTVTIMFRSL